MATPKKQIVADAAAVLGIPPEWLDNLIYFESRWNPQASNPKSSAKGLIQFVDSTARSLGFMSSQDLITKAPTIAEQMPLVIAYLKKYMPFPTIQSLAMSVFYSAARNWPPEKMFPDSVRAVNPGINCPADYIKRLLPAVAPSVAAVLVVAVTAVVYFALRR
jgi:hypothetical protein